MGGSPPGKRNERMSSRKNSRRRCGSSKMKTGTGRKRRGGEVLVNIHAYATHL